LETFFRRLLERNPDRFRFSNEKLSTLRLAPLPDHPVPEEDPDEQEE
jgi:hypothetical protein